MKLKALLVCLISMPLISMEPDTNSISFHRKDFYAQQNAKQKEKLKLAIEKAIENGHNVNQPLPRDKQISLDSPFHHTYNPLLHQVCFDDFFVDTVRKLLEVGADIWMHDKHFDASVFAMAALGNAHQNLKILIGQVKSVSPGLVMNIHADGNRRGALHYAIHDRPESLVLLLQSGADPNKEGFYGSPLRHVLFKMANEYRGYCIFKREAKKEIKMLSLYGADLNEKINTCDGPVNAPPVKLSLVDYARQHTPKDAEVDKLLESMPSTLNKIEQLKKLRKDQKSFVSWLPKELLEQEIYFLLEDEIPLPEEKKESNK